MALTTFVCVGILRLSHVDITAPDLELATAYYTEVLGLDVSGQTRDETGERVFLKGWDERDHHCLAIRQDTRVGIDRFSFKVDQPGDLDAFETRIERAGSPVRRVSVGEEVGQGESIRFEVPSGHEMELVHDVEKLGSRLPLLKPPPIVLDRPDPDFPTITWTDDRAGRAVFYYEGVLNERFATVHT